MSDTAVAEPDDLVIFPPRMGSLATKLGPLTVTQGCYLLGSASLGALLGYTLHGLAPRSGWATAAAILAFVGATLVGLLFGFVRRADLPLLRYLALRHRFHARPQTLEGEATQTFVQLVGLTHDTLLLPNDVFVRVVEVKGSNFALLKASDRAEKVQSFLAFLNGLDFDIQIITRPDRFDNRPFLRPLLARLDSQTSPLLGTLTEQYLEFFDERTANTLSRKFYVATAVRLAQAAPHLYQAGAVPTPETRRSEAGKVLDRRVEALVDDLVGLGLEAELLTGKRLVDMLRSYYRFGEKGGTSASGPVRSVAEALRPAKVQFFPDYTIVGSEFVRVLQVQEYPARLHVAFLYSLLTMPSRVDVTLHISPVPQDLALTMLRQEVVRLEVERLGKVEKGSVDTLALQHQLEVFEGLRDALTKQEERLFRSGLFISVRADSLEELNALTSQVQGTLRGLMVKARAPVFQQHAALRSILPFGRDHLETDYPLQGSALATMYPFISGAIAQEGGVLYGFSQLNGTPVIFDRFKEGNYNSCIFGASGSGKSYALKSEILRQMVLRPTLRVYVIDPLGEFGDLTRSLEGAVLRVGPNESTYLNPMWVGRTALERKGRAQAFLEVILDLTQEERALLDGLLSRMFRERREEFTLGDVAQVLGRTESSHADRLVLLLEPFLTGSYSFLNQRMTVDLSARMVTFDLNALMTQSRAMLVPVMFVVFDFVKARCQEDMEPKIFAVDEAWYLMGRPESAQTLSDLARHTRHNNVGLTLISQTAEDFLNDDRGQVILRNSAITTLFRHKNVSAAMQDFFDLTEEEVPSIKTARTGKEVGYSTSLFITGNTRTPILVEAAGFEHWLITSDPNEVKQKFQDQGPAAPASKHSPPAPLAIPSVPPTPPSSLLPTPPVATASKDLRDSYPSYHADIDPAPADEGCLTFRIGAALGPPSSSVERRTEEA